MGKFEDALKKYAEYVINKSKENLAKGGKYGSYNKSGELSNSLEYKIVKGKVSFLGENYGVFQDQGVKGAKSTYLSSSESPYRYRNLKPPANVFEQWIKKSKASLKTKFVTSLSRYSLLSGSNTEFSLKYVFIVFIAAFNCSSSLYCFDTVSILQLYWIDTVSILYPYCT